MKWRKRCTEFAAIREMIDSGGDFEGIKEALIKICRKYAGKDDVFADAFRDLAEDIRDMEVENDDDCDFMLNEFYDLCDAAGIWLEW